MAGQGEGEGAGVNNLESHIQIIKYVIFFLNILIWLIAASVLGLCMWLRFEPGIDDWVTKLELQPFYIGVYVLILGAVLVMVVSFLGCFAALSENQVFMMIFIITQAVGFVCGLSGSAVLLDNSTYESKLQPMIRTSMRNLIMNSGHHDPSRFTLNLVQEHIGCCGSDGSNDYINWNQPVPPTCRDSVTGNAYYHGCVDELTWFFEEKAGWVVALAMTICFIHVINIALSVLLMQALKLEEKQSTIYRR
ncbi:Tetraspanin 2A [Carabus blaptoides fortunei]